MKVYVLNSPVLTDFGSYKYDIISVSEAREILKTHGFTSAVGHEATATFMSQILKIDIPVNRVRIQMQPGDIAIVFQLLERLPEGKVLSEKELRWVPFKLGLLVRIK